MKKTKTTAKTKPTTDVHESIALAMAGASPPERYREFEVVVENVTPVEMAWAVDITRSLADGSNCDRVPEVGVAPPADEQQSDFVCAHDRSDRTLTVSNPLGRDGHVEQAAWFLHVFLRRFRPHEVVALPYQDDRRTGNGRRGYGGGATFISARGIERIDTQEWLAKRLKPWRDVEAFLRRRNAAIARYVAKSPPRGIGITSEERAEFVDYVCGYYLGDPDGWGGWAHDWTPLTRREVEREVDTLLRGYSYVNAAHPLGSRVDLAWEGCSHAREVLACLVLGRRHPDRIEELEHSALVHALFALDAAAKRGDAKGRQVMATPCIHCGTSATTRRNATRRGTLGRTREVICLLVRSDGRGEHDGRRCPHPAEVVMIAESEESVALARRQLANMHPPLRLGPPSMDAARTETDPDVLERWAIHAAKRAELWRYRAVLFANPNMTERGRKKLARAPRTLDDPKGCPN